MESRWRFTLKSLLVVVLVVGVVFALLAAWVPRARELSRRNQCAKNLQTLTSAMQTHDEINGELPPLATDDNMWSWCLLLPPYLESGGVERFSLIDPPAGPENLPEVLKFRYSWLQCPTQRTEIGKRLSGTFAGGQPTDYAAVSTADWNLRWTNAADGVLVFRQAPPTPTSWAKSGVSMADILDGLTHTAAFGEKHMRPDWLGGPLDEPALIAKKGPLLERLAGVRAGNRWLAKDPLDPDEWKFGSWHSGAVNFAMCDGSVRPLSVETDLKVLSLLTCRNDSKGVADIAPADDPLSP